MALPSLRTLIATRCRSGEVAGEFTGCSDGLDKTQDQQLAEQAAEAREIIYQAWIRRRSASRSWRPIGSWNGEAGNRRRRRGAQLGDRRGSADGELRRPARELPEHRGEASCSRRAAAASPRLFTDRAIAYRIDNGFDHFKVALSVGVMKMVRSDLARQRRDLHARHRVRLSRRGVHHRRLRPRREHRAGHGRSRRVLRPQADLPRRAIARCCAARSAASRYAWSTRRAQAASHAQRADARGPTASASASPTPRCWSSPTTRSASRTTTRDAPGMPMPMDIEWAKDGVDGKLYIVQARPETVASQRARGHASRPTRSKGKGAVLVSGRAVGEKIAAGHGARDRDGARSRRISSPARCWSPTPPARTGSR